MEGRKKGWKREGGETFFFLLSFPLATWVSTSSEVLFFSFSSLSSARVCVVKNVEEEGE